MDDRRHATPGTGRTKARPPRSDGIFGRLTYTPAQVDERIGQIRRNWAEDEAPRFKQVTPFAQWCPPTTTPSPHPGNMRPLQIARSQKRWLLDRLPEASVGDEVVESLLREEIAASKAPKQATFADTALLFSVGEVTDCRGNEPGFKGHPALALASGVSGNVLQLIGLSQEEWVWVDAEIKVRVHGASRQLEGEWCQDGVPISLVRFAIDPRQNDPIRWLLVQNGSRTTVYEPELRTIPMPTAGDASRVSGRSTASRIFANPLFTIPCDRTGGGLQTDICYSRPIEVSNPQLAIIDQTGCWSVWDITGRRAPRPKTITPTLKMCGNTVAGSIPKLPSSSMTEPQPHKLLWLLVGTKSRLGTTAISANRTRSPSAQSRMSADPDPPPPSKRILLLSSPKSLHLIDLASETTHSVSHLVLEKDTHRILGLAPSRLDPAQAFILTSTDLLWVAAREGKNDSLTLDILVSCPHQKDVSDPTLRLDVSPGAYINGLMACFVCVRSASDAQVTIFWFIKPEPGSATPVRYHRDLITLKGRPSKFAGLSILPAGRRVGEGQPTSAAGRALRGARLRFFQLLTLGRDLDVHSALCAWSDQPGVPVPPPDTRLELEDDPHWRRRLLQSLTDAFAVPDEFDEHAVFGKGGLGWAAPERLPGGIQQVVDFGLVARRLTTGGSLNAGDDEEMVDSAGSEDFDFIAEAIELEKDDGYMPRRSVLDLATSRRPGRGLLQLAREWDAQQEALHRRTGEWVFVPEARRPLTDFGPDDLVERLRNLFVEWLPEGGNENDSARQNRESVLQIMAAEIFLSNVGVSAVPPSWTAGDGSLQSSLPFVSSPTLLSSQPSLPSSSSSRKGKAKAIVAPRAGEGEGGVEKDEEQADAVALRLRKYARLDASPKFRGEPALTLSRWELGADPDHVTWRSGRDQETEEAISRRRRKIEARRRKAERLSQRILGRDDDDDDSSVLSTSAMDLSSQSLGTQPLPVILSSAGGGGGGGGKGKGRKNSSQQQQQHQASLPPSTPLAPSWEFSSQRAVGGFGSPRVFVGSPLRREYRRDSGMSALSSSQPLQPQSQESQPQSQSQSQSQWHSQLKSQSQAQGSQLSGTPSQPRSQVLPGVFGGRLSPFKRSSPLKKGKRKSELRLSGFR